MYTKPIQNKDKSYELDAVIYKKINSELSKDINYKNKDEFPLDNLLKNNKDVKINFTDDNIEIVKKIISGRNGDIRIKLFKVDKKEIMPAVLVFHGGNFIDGSLEDCDSFCRLLCEKSQAVIISVDYRLAPKYKFPQGLFDCYDSIRYIYENSEKLGINKNCISVCGESAGGNFATACAMMDKDLNRNYIRFQILINPNIYLNESDYKNYKFDINSYNNKINSEKWINYIDNIRKIRQDVKYSYMGTNEFISNQYASPLCAPSLKGISDVLMIMGEDDYLRLQDEAYSQKLESNDVKCKIIMYKGYNNSFLNTVDISEQALDVCLKIAEEINNRFNN